VPAINLHQLFPESVFVIKYNGISCCCYVAFSLGQEGCEAGHFLSEPWLLFEAGALSKKDDAHVCCTYLWQLQAAEVPQPLGQFQATKCEEHDTRGLECGINPLSRLKCEGAVQEAYDHRCSTFPRFRMVRGRALRKES